MKRYLVLTLLIAASFCISARGKETPQPQGRIIRTALLNGPTGIGALNLMDQPPEWAGDDTLEFEIIVDPRMLVPRLIQGEFHAAVVPSNMGALLYSKGAPYRMAAVVGHGVLYVLGRDGRLESIQALGDSTLHLSGKGATPDYLSLYFLDQAGMVPGEDLLLDYSFTHPDLTRALIAGQVDYALLPEPFATTALEADEELSVALDYQELWQELHGSSYPISVLLISNEMEESMADLLPAYLEAYESSIEWVNANPEEASSLVDNHGFTLNQEIIAQAIPRCNLNYLDFQQSREELTAFFEVLYAMNPASIGGSLPGEEAYLNLEN